MPSMMVRSLVTRHTLWLLLLLAALGAFYVWMGYTLGMQRETEQTQAQLSELMDTVEPSVAIACFIEDPQLAGEVAQGLLGNRIVQGVFIDAAAKPLASATDGPAAALDSSRVLTRQIRSPFDPAEVVGEIRLIPDQREIAKRVAQASWFVGLLMLFQVLAIGIATALLAYVLVTRPLRQVAVRLHGLQPERGAQLDPPRGHEADEIGELVRYINGLLGRMVAHIDEERRLRQELEIDERMYRSIFEHAETGIFLINGSGELLSHNPSFMKILEEAAPTAGERSLHLAGLFDGDLTRVKALTALCRQENRSIHQDLRVAIPRGLRQQERWIHLTLTPIGDRLFQGIVNDITERKRVELEALEAAKTDSLTGLLNRMGFVAQMRDRFRHGLPDPCWSVALMLIDLDLFKQINDSLGHDAGDRALIDIAQLLKRLVRRSDLVGRLGGDEFVILLEQTDRSDVIEGIAQKIVEAGTRPLYVGDGRTARIGFSIGIAVGGSETATPERLFKQADEAMYRAKRAGGNSFQFYEAVEQDDSRLGTATCREREQVVTLAQARAFDAGIEHPAPPAWDRIEAVEGTGDHAQDRTGGVGVATPVDDVDQR